MNAWADYCFVLKANLALGRVCACICLFDWVSLFVWLSVLNPGFSFFLYRQLGLASCSSSLARMRFEGWWLISYFTCTAIIKYFMGCVAGQSIPLGLWVGKQVVFMSCTKSEKALSAFWALTRLRLTFPSGLLLGQLLSWAQSSSFDPNSASFN